MEKVVVNGIEHLWELARLAHQQGRDVMVLCPGHNDTNPSLAINTGEDGRILLDCKAGCATENICYTLGVSIKDLFADNHSGNGDITTYDYKDASGKLIYQVCRFPNKKFVQRRPGNNGEFIWNLKGIKRLLYRLPELNKADKKRYVLIPEGEKDCDRLLSMGMVATCNSGGAGNWQPEISEPLRGRRVVLIADHDEPGHKHAQSVAKMLTGIAEQIKIIEFDNLPEGGDVSDWLDAGGTKEGLRNLVNQTKPFKPVQDRQLQHQILSTVEPKKIEYLQPEVIPLGMITSLVSQEGEGKSTLASNIIAHITQGKPWPNAPSVPNPKGHVIIFNHEEDVSCVLVPRLIANGADLSRVVTGRDIIDLDGNEQPFNIEHNISELDTLIDEFPETKLVIFDPITSYCSCNENSNSEVRKALKPLVDFAARRNIAVLALTHLNKKVDLGMINRTIGSRAWSAVPRMVWGIRTEQVEDDEGHKTDTENRFFLNIKCNIGPKPKGLKFSIGDGGRVIWDGERINMSMDENCGLKTSRINEAADWLQKYLGNSSMSSAVIFEEGEKQGFTRNLLYRAKEKLKIKASKLGFGNEGQWFWELCNDE